MNNKYFDGYIGYHSDNISAIVYGVLCLNINNYVFGCNFRFWEYLGKHREFKEIWGNLGNLGNLRKFREIREIRGNLVQ